MRFFEIDDIKGFMTALLSRDTFRDFELDSAQIVTFMKFSIDGLQQREYDAETQEAAGQRAGLTPWMSAAPVIFSMVKGKKPPVSMKLVLRLNDVHTAKIIEKADLPLSPEDLKGLFLNISYEQGKAVCTSGTSLAVFTMDRSVENAWDHAVESFLLRFIR